MINDDFSKLVDSIFGVQEMPFTVDVRNKIDRVVMDRTDTAIEFKFYVPGVKPDEIKVKTKDKKLIVSVKNDDKYETRYINLRPYAENSDTKAIGYKPSGDPQLSRGILTIKFDYIVNEEDKDEEYKINEAN